MLRVKVTMFSGYAGCPSETVEFEYEGTEAEFDCDDEASTEILEMLLNGEFPHFSLSIDTEEVDEDEDEDEYE